MSKQTTAHEQELNDYWIYPDATKALEISLYYGFTPIAPVSLEKSDKDHAKSLQTEHHHVPAICPEEQIALLRTHFTHGQPQLPFMVVRERKHEKNNKQSKRSEICLDAIGTARSITDATLIKTAYEIIRAEGYHDIEIQINSVGDRDSLTRFSRELQSYFKKHSDEMTAECRQLLKKNVFEVLLCSHEKCKPIIANAPKAINHLSESSRSHFKEVLELLEMASLPYSINNTLIDNYEFASHIIFKIIGKDPAAKDRAVLARGVRWTNLAKKMGIKKDIPGVSAVISLQKPLETNHTKIRKPQFYFVQMGQEAKLKSLIIIETLRQAKIPVYHSLTKDKLTAQLMSAENMKVPYILIMGQKESIENTLLIREMNNRSQETIKITLVAEYLKNLL